MAWDILAAPYLTYFFPFPNSPSAAPLLLSSANFDDGESEYNVGAYSVNDGYYRVLLYASRMFAGTSPRSARRWRYIGRMRLIDGNVCNFWDAFRNSPNFWELAVGESVALRLRPIEYAVPQLGQLTFRLGSDTYMSTTVVA